MRTTLALIALATGVGLFTPALAQEPGPRPARSSIHQPASAREPSATTAQRSPDSRTVQRERGRSEVKGPSPKERTLGLYVDPAPERIRRPLQERIPGATRRLIRW